MILMKCQVLFFPSAAVVTGCLMGIFIRITVMLLFQFLVYDTQMIVGGRKHELSPEEYVYGALQLYIDVVYLFLIILSLFGKSN